MTDVPGGRDAGLAKVRTWFLPAFARRPLLSPALWCPERDLNPHTLSSNGV